jgi:hypothetical protein
MKSVSYIHRPVSAHAHAHGVVYYSRTGDRSHQRYPHNDPRRFPIQHLPAVPAEVPSYKLPVMSERLLPVAAAWPSA